MDGDATIILATDPGSDGTKLTVKFCEQEGKPYLMIDPRTGNAPEMVRDFLESERPRVLNVAGNRESKSPGIAVQTAKVVDQALKF